jgi:NSS family neurotransmitter:Na+ symporter
MRENFNSKFGFILAAAGSAIGLGNIYQFPFKAGEGGGAAFLFLYLLFTFVFCLPVMISEIAIGRAARQNAAGSYRVLGHKKWSLLGKTGVLTGFVIFSYYIMIAGWILSYLFDYLTGTPAISQRFPELVANPLRVFGFAALFMAITVLFIARGVRGIESAVRLLMPALTILLLGLVIYALTLDGASQGLAFYLQPSADEFLKTSTIHSALSQAFFSLSLGMGALITYGSYMKSNQSIVKSAALIAIADVTIAFLAGLLIFSRCFFFWYESVWRTRNAFCNTSKSI